MDSRKILKIIHFQDPNDGTMQQDAVGFSKYSNSDLQKMAEKIVEDFEKEDFDDWSYDDVLDEMIKRGYLEIPDFEVDWAEISL